MIKMNRTGGYMSKGHLPNFLIIGAAKSGTTSLHAYLSAHPDICMSQKKELRFFVPTDRYGRFDNGVDWYKNNFNRSALLYGESSPQYTVYPKISGVPERIHSVVGYPKLIYILRDPVNRVLSHYVQIVDEYYPVQDFRAWLSTITERQSYFYSLYFFQLSQYLRIFPRSNILVLVSERLAADPQPTLRSVFDFLGVDANFWSPTFDDFHNVRRSTKRVARWFDVYGPEFLKQQLREPVLRSKLWRLYRLIHWVSRVGGEKILKPTLTEQEDKYIQSLFRDDVVMLREFLSDPIPEWRAYA
jgi:hypothetical protein